MNAGQRVVLGSLGLMAALITIRSVASRPGMPAPSAYFATGIVFTGWYLLASVAAALAGTLAVGTVVSALLAPYVAGGSGESPISQLAGLVSQYSGGNSSQGASA